MQTRWVHSCICVPVNYLFRLAWINNDVAYGCLDRIISRKWRSTRRRVPRDYWISLILLYRNCSARRHAETFERPALRKSQAPPWCVPFQECEYCKYEDFLSRSKRLGSHIFTCPLTSSYSTVPASRSCAKQAPCIHVYTHSPFIQQLKAYMYTNTLYMYIRRSSRISPLNRELVLQTNAKQSGCYKNTTSRSLKDVTRWSS